MDICVDGDDWYEGKEGMVLFLFKKNVLLLIVEIKIIIIIKIK